MRRLMAVPDYEKYYFEALVKTAMSAGGGGGWLQQEATREYNQIQQAAYDDPNKLYLNTGYLLPRPPLLSGSKRPKADIASPLMKLAK